MPSATQDTFVPLGEYMRTRYHQNDQVCNTDDQMFNQEICHPEERLGEAPEITDAIASARRFSSAVAESVERSVERVLREIAYEVLGRELLLAPVDIDTIVKRLLAEAEETSVIRVHGNPERGDVVLELRDGTLDARLSVRVEHALRTVGVV